MTVTAPPVTKPLVTEYVPAPLWRQLCAMGYDTFLLFPLSMLYSFAHLMAKGMLFGFDGIKSAKAGHAGDPLLFVGVLCCWCIFYYWFWTRNGQTLGMQSWRLRVQQPNGENITGKQALLRLLIAPLSLLVAGTGYFWCLSGKKATWHDIVSQTCVVVLPKKSAQT